MMWVNANGTTAPTTTAYPFDAKARLSAAQVTLLTALAVDGYKPHGARWRSALKLLHAGLVSVTSNVVCYSHGPYGRTRYALDWSAAPTQAGKELVAAMAIAAFLQEVTP